LRGKARAWSQIILLQRERIKRQTIALRRLQHQREPRNVINQTSQSRGYKLANQGVDTRSLQHYLGHKNIQHTVRYTELSPQRFRDFWKD
jgi:hypothetical protein